MYEFFIDKIEFSWKEVLVTAFFSVFIFKPTVLVDVFQAAKNAIKKE